MFTFVELDKLRIRWDKGIPFLCAVTLRHSEDVQKQTLIIWLHTRPQGIGSPISLCPSCKRCQARNENPPASNEEGLYYLTRRHCFLIGKYATFFSSKEFKSPRCHDLCLKLFRNAWLALSRCATGISCWTLMNQPVQQHY